MISRYLVGIDKQDHAKIKEEYQGAFRFRSRLSELLDQNIRTEQEAMLSDEDFVAEEQIKRLANIRTLKKIQKMLK